MAEIGFNKAVKTFGSQAQLASALGVSKGRVSQWRNEGVPVRRCMEIEKLSRAIAVERHDERLVVVCEDLRPDLEWQVVRCNPIPGISAETSACN
jgi:DNA-binding transcriptional regulator YdaS (Cro superfamily)